MKFQNYNSTEQISKIWVQPPQPATDLVLGICFDFTDVKNAVFSNAVAYCKSFEFFRVCSSANLTPPQRYSVPKNRRGEWQQALLRGSS